MVLQRSAATFFLWKIVAYYTSVAVGALIVFAAWTSYQFELQQQSSFARMYSVFEHLMDGSDQVEQAQQWFDLEMATEPFNMFASVALYNDQNEVLFDWRLDEAADFGRMKTYNWQSVDGTNYELKLQTLNSALPNYLLEQTGPFFILLVVQVIILLTILSYFVRRSVKDVFYNFMREVSLINLKSPAPLKPNSNFVQFREYRHIISGVNRVILSLAKSRAELSEMNGDLECRIQQKTADLENKNQELVALNQQLSVMANTDALTQVYNRTRFDVLFSEYVALSTRRQTALSLLLVDLDDFKKVNDCYGHQVGDAVLTHAAQKISECAKDQGIVARWGGEEFVVLLPYAELEDAQANAELIRQTLERAEFEEQSIRVTTSIGVATLIQQETASEFLKRADDALYLAKGTGRNRVIMAATASELMSQPLKGKSSVEFVDVESEPNQYGSEASLTLKL